MNPIEHFLAELYEIDPDLRSHEQELRPLIEHLLSHDPARAPDEAFVEELRRKLSVRAQELSTSPSPFLLSTMQKLLYTLGGAAFAVLIVAPTAYYLRTSSPANPSSDTQSLFSYQVTDTGEHAFGDLSSVQAGRAGGRGQGGGGGGGVGLSAVPSGAPAPAVAEGLAATEPSVSDAKLIAPGLPPNPEITDVEYVYKGTLPELPKDTVSVFKRQKDSARPTLERIASAFQVGAANLASFAGAKVDSITFSQDVSMGYIITLLLKEGSLMINQNWEQWPHPEQQCQDEACFRRFRISLSDLPSDESALSIADEFIKEHGIDVSSYGAPEVDVTWRRDYDRTPDKSQAYIPDSVQVVYPLQLDGKPVFDQGGQKTGIRVGVSVRQKRVSEVWGIQNQSYLRSSYEAVSSNEEVLQYLSTFERPSKEYLPKDVKVKKVDVTLGEPEQGYVVYYTFDAFQSQELVVPALLFPVQSARDNPYIWRQTVTVPLAKELLKQQAPIAIPLDAAPRG